MYQKLKKYGNQICGYSCVHSDKNVPAFHFLTLSQETLTMFLRVNKVRYYYPHSTNKKQQITCCKIASQSWHLNTGFVILNPSER